MSRDIVFLSVDDVIAIHEDTLAHEGGLAGLRDGRLLDSAVMMAQQCFAGERLHPDLPSMAAAYLYHLCQNHPFNDGNKRAAAAATLVFLRGNGAGKLPRPTALRDTTLRVAAGKLSKPKLIAWMRRELGR